MSYPSFMFADSQIDLKDADNFRNCSTGLHENMNLEWPLVQCSISKEKCPIRPENLVTAMMGAKWSQYVEALRRLAASKRITEITVPIYSFLEEV